MNGLNLDLLGECAKEFPPLAQSAFSPMNKFAKTIATTGAVSNAKTVSSSTASLHWYFMHFDFFQESTNVYAIPNVRKNLHKSHWQSKII